MDLLKPDAFTNDIEKIIIDNLVYRFIAERDYTIESENKEIINKLIKKIKKEPEITIDTGKINRDKFNDFMNRMTNNQFKKPWSRLTYEQKFTKLDEYYKANKKDITSTKIKKLIENPKFSKLVEYNKETCKIEHIKDSS